MEHLEHGPGDCRSVTRRSQSARILTERLEKTHRGPQEYLYRAVSDLEEHKEDKGAYEGEESSEPDGDDVLSKRVGELGIRNRAVHVTEMNFPA